MLLRSFESFEKTENGYLIHGDAADVKLVFMTDDIIRIRVHFDKGTPMEEESYTLVTTAWEDRMDTLLKDERTRITALDVPCAEDEKTLTFETAHLTLKLFKKPFHFELYDKSGELIYQDLRERAFEKDQIGRLSHFSKVDRDYDHFYGFGEKTGHLDKKGRRLRMSPKDALDLCCHLLGNVRVVHTGQGLVLGGQDELAAVETVRAVIQCLQIAVAERQQAGVHPALIALLALALQVHLPLCGHDGLNIVGLAQGFHPHIIVHAEQGVFEVSTGEAVLRNFADAAILHVAAKQSGQHHTDLRLALAAAALDDHHALPLVAGDQAVADELLHRGNVLRVEQVGQEP